MRFRFTIRDLLWLTALVALAVAWWVDKARTERRFAEQHKLMMPYRIYADDDGRVFIQNLDTLRSLQIPPDRKPTPNAR
jgi:hypothetical protein